MRIYSCCRHILLLTLSCFFFTSTLLAGNENHIVVKSPDGNVRLLVQVNNGSLLYSITFNNDTIIEPSLMGLVIDGKMIGREVAIGKAGNYVIDETYATLGVHNTAVNKCNGIKIDIIGAISPSFVLDARVYNDGVAFRYLVAGKGTATVDSDSTEFRLPASVNVWSQPNVKYYEGKYNKKRIDDYKAGELCGPPITVELSADAGYAAITEAGLVDFAGMSLMADGNNGFTANLAGATKLTGTIASPWRIIEVGKDLNALVNCDMITNVSPACDARLFPAGVNTAWIKPGKAVWSWLAESRAITLDNMKHFTDLAADLGFTYNLVDEGWGNWNDGGRDKWELMKELVDYSAKKGVKIWVWQAYPDRKGIEGINTPEKRLEFFKKCKEIGIAGLKVDFFNSESQEIVAFYQNALKEAAEYQLMMDFHGANKPTGENRTWPNELTREAIRGLENQPPWAPGNTTLPFTRFLAGPADFTPVNFGKRLGEVSWAHHTATMIVFTSPLMCLGADPQMVLDNPCKKIIQSIPPAWDETIVLPQSRIGDLALYARRKGSTWYLAALNGLNETRTIIVKLAFLKKGKYAATLLKDDPRTQAAVFQEKTKVSAGQSIKILMNAAGGFVAEIDKE